MTWFKPFANEVNGDDLVLDGVMVSDLAIGPRFTG
jgi:hypothetical protein